MKTLTFYETTILDAISLDGREIKDEANMKTLDKIKAVYEIFLSEYVHKYNEHLPKEHLLKEWMMGLPSALEVPFMYHEILHSGKAWGFNINSEVEEDNFLNLYWKRCAEAFFTLKDNL